MTYTNSPGSTPKGIRFLLSAFALILLAILPGCGEDSPTGGESNIPPETRIVTGPREDVPVSYLVSIAWLGSDTDGPVQSYQWRMSDNGPDGVLDPGDTLGLPWHSTTKTDSVFAAPAQLDSFPPDVGNPLITDPIDLRNWQTHSFFVRAVDRNGAIDPTPARIDFTVTTLLPRATWDLVSLTRDTCQPTNTTLALGIATEDDDDPDGLAVAYRYALVAVEDLDPAAFDGTGISPLPAGGCIDRSGYELLDAGRLFPESVWSEWFDYVETQDPQIDLTLPNLPPGSSWFLALQARDRAGAVTPTFVWNRNFLHFRVDGSFFPTLGVTDPLGGVSDFNGPAATVVDLGVLPDSTVVEFTWSADASNYLGQIDGYRFAVDVADPLNVGESEWSVPWIDIRRFTGDFAPGPHNFVVAALDDSGQITSAVYRFDLPAN